MRRLKTSLKTRTFVGRLVRLGLKSQQAEQILIFAKSSTEARLKTAHLFHGSSCNLRSARAECDMQTSYGWSNPPLLTNPKGRHLDERPHRRKSAKPWSVCQLSLSNAMPPVGTPMITLTSPRYPIKRQIEYNVGN